MKRARMPSTLAAMAALWLFAAPAPSQAQVALGRLFATPAERQTLDANRGKTQALAPNSQGQQGADDAPLPVPGPPAGEMDGLSGKGYDSQGGTIQGPAGPGAGTGAGAGAGAGGAPGAAGQKAAAPPPPEALVMNGVLRTSGGRSTVWLNDVPQSAAQNKLSRRGPASPALTVTLPSGKKVLLKAGQRYDLNEGRVKDINEP
jgi:hypothetical protein